MTKNSLFYRAQILATQQFNTTSLVQNYKSKVLNGSVTNEISLMQYPDWTSSLNQHWYSEKASLQPLLYQSSDRVTS